MKEEEGLRNIEMVGLKGRFNDELNYDYIEFGMPVGHPGGDIQKSIHVFSP